MRTIQLEPGEKLRVKFPDSIGYVDISTGAVNGPTGWPVVSASVTSTSEDGPAEDGRYYEPQYNGIHHMVYMAGRPAGGGNE